jgi:hypothetical protein
MGNDSIDPSRTRHQNAEIPISTLAKRPILHEGNGNAGDLDANDEFYLQLHQHNSGDHD